MPRLQKRIARDEHRQVRVPEVVEDIGEAARAKPLADHESAFLEQGELVWVQAKVGKAVTGSAPVFALIELLGIRIELIPEPRGRCVPGKAGKIARAGGEHSCK